jgi:hypothetical protein
VRRAAAIAAAMGGIKVSDVAFDPAPTLPPEIENAAQSGELVVFVGAGISKLVKCPTWDEFATGVLEQLVPKGISYYELSQIKQIPDPKKRLSIAKIIAERKGIAIDYASILKAPKLPKKNVYAHLNSFRSAFVTTNYERYLAPESNRSVPENRWRFYERAHLLGAHLDTPGCVLHIHGCVTSPSTMVITTRDYLEHYASQEVHDLLTYLFEKKTVLFLGYGLEELEILEYVLSRGGAQRTNREIYRRFSLQGFFNAEMSFFNLLREYYRKSFGTEIIGFPKDAANYGQQVAILSDWSKKLTVADLSLADQVTALEDEING